MNMVGPWEIMDTLWYTTSLRTWKWP
jgi:hypothetical protein